jgi:hypothetical protein
MVWVWLLVALAVIVVFAAAAGAVLVRRQRERTARLRERFGPEYDRAVKAAGGQRAGEAELEARLERHQRLQLSPSENADSAQYAAEWNEIEKQFDTAEIAALARAEAVVTTVLAERGYPMGSFDQRAADLSLDYPEEIGHYRRAHAAYRRADEGEATREDLYEALQHYRAFLDALLPSNAAIRETAASADGRRQQPPTDTVTLTDARAEQQEN